MSLELKITVHYQMIAFRLNCFFWEIVPTGELGAEFLAFFFQSSFRNYSRLPGSCDVAAPAADFRIKEKQKTTHTHTHTARPQMTVRVWDNPVEKVQRDGEERRRAWPKTERMFGCIHHEQWNGRGRETHKRVPRDRWRRGLGRSDTQGRYRFDIGQNLGIEHRKK